MYYLLFFGRSGRSIRRRTACSRSAFSCGSKNKKNHNISFIFGPTIRFDDCENAFPQTVHLCGFSPKFLNANFNFFWKFRTCMDVSVLFHVRLLVESFAAIFTGIGTSENGKMEITP